MKRLTAFFGIILSLITALFFANRKNKRLESDNTSLKDANDTLKTIKEIDDEAKTIERTNALDDRSIRDRMRDKGYLRPKR